MEKFIVKSFANPIPAVYNDSMKSILIKDTTKEEREKIVLESLGDGWDVGCDFSGTGVDYQQYIDGKKELRQLNEDARLGLVVAYPEETPKSCGMGN